MFLIKSAFVGKKALYANIKFPENPTSGIRVVPCGGTNRPTDMMKLIVDFRNFANTPNIHLKVNTAAIAKTIF